MTQEEQLERLRKGFPWLQIEAAATIGRGVQKLSEEELREAVEYQEKASVKGKCKFIPASGAASRMFKDVFALKEETIGRLADNLEKFAFYSPEVFGTAPFEPEKVAHTLLEADGLGYGSKPKGVLKFHRYPSETRTAIAEHLVEGQAYMRDADGNVNLVVTISPEHQGLFEEALAEVKGVFEERYGVKYNVSFTYQDKATDTVASTPDGELFLKEDGTPLRRPAGHGALIHNLNAVEEELVTIKNIDNVAVERLLPDTVLYKKALMGRALMLRDRIFAYLEELDLCSEVKIFEPVGFLPGLNASHYDPFATPECQALCQEIEDFLYEELCIEVPAARSCEDRVGILRSILDRPIRVCGMVRNEGEPGGGPFIIREKDGSTSLQILESVQISPEYTSVAQAATHFNPVDLVCCIRDYKGEKFNLPEFVDEETGFISSKSYQGRELKALELPGLWNGSMSRWNTLFVEVPASTFNPVKVVLDLLRDAHQN